MKKARVLCFICGVNISNMASACAVLNFCMLSNHKILCIYVILCLHFLRKLLIFICQNGERFLSINSTSI
jgi:type IV secretory pathway VirB3-like protein